jgi:hypothetical protein
VSGCSRHSDTIYRDEAVAVGGLVQPSASRTLIIAVNESSGRRITIRSPLRLRPLPGKGCEFCNQPYNRTAGDWACPYCGRRFETAT